MVIIMAKDALMPQLIEESVHLLALQKAENSNKTNSKTRLEVTRNRSTLALRVKAIPIAENVI